MALFHHQSASKFASFLSLSSALFICSHLGLAAFCDFLILVYINNKKLNDHRREKERQRLVTETNRFSLLIKLFPCLFSCHTSAQLGGEGEGREMGESTVFSFVISWFARVLFFINETVNKKNMMK